MYIKKNSTHAEIFFSLFLFSHTWNKNGVVNFLNSHHNGTVGTEYVGTNSPKGSTYHSYSHIFICNINVFLSFISLLSSNIMLYILCFPSCSLPSCQFFSCWQQDEREQQKNAYKISTINAFYTRIYRI